MKKWKLSFWGLVAVNIIIISVLLIAVFMPERKPDSIDSENQIPSSGVELDVFTNKIELTRLINSFLKKESKNQPLEYQVLLDKDVLLIGTIKAFNKEIDLELRFVPVATPNGDLLLEQKSISLGQLSIPVSFVLTYIKEKYALPEWVAINPKDNTVYVSLTNMKLGSDVQVKVNTFDLENDDISFKLVVPVE
ncbi:YpmS family protein [Cytobacillus sp. S13-E01]|uniref:YpmS family protein n=1 Tax=Cytobacillus sp. S13-E01 TaxID=3031326 RepID=UPI0023D81FBE|nr:YpmS family protein [Cytobacillus sp. S13-E01]MDF0725715.1 YpmS family protein [Cytobacillus sp. S13-E01]